MSERRAASPTRTVAVIGSVGVPARYGGFETLAERLALGISPGDLLLTFYCERAAYPEVEGHADFGGHRRYFLRLRANGASSMFHDAFAMLHAAIVRRVDCMLLLGYSGAWMLPVVRWLRPSMRTVTNIDGMEWRRDKFGRVARATLRVLEWFACRFSHTVIADNEALVPLVRNIYGVEPVVIAYGGDHTLVEAGRCEIEPGYLLAIARVEPENNCGLILEAGVKAGARLVFVGNWDASTYGRELKARFAGVAGLTLIDSVYDLARLAQLRQGARAYLHGHSVGGTNPSLVEALFHSDRLLAFDCAFNRATLDGGGAYFKDIDTLVGLLADPSAGRVSAAQLLVLRSRYRWERVITAYGALLFVQSGYDSASASAGAKESLADKDG